MREEHPVWFQLLSDDAALVVALLDHLAALAVARPGLALTDEQRLFLADTPSARDPHEMADSMSDLASAIKAQLRANTPEPDD